MKNLGGHFDKEQKEKQIVKLESQMQEENFWDNPELANKISMQVSHLKKELASFMHVDQKINDLKEIINLLEEQTDLELQEEMENDLKNLEIEISELETSLLLNGQYDDLNCYLEIHPGAGGTES